MSGNSEILFEEGYYPNSTQLEFKIGQKDGKAHGPAFGWYEDGKPKFTGFWHQGEPHSLWTRFDLSGNPSYEYRYQGKKLNFKPEHAELMHAFLSNIGYFADEIARSSPRIEFGPL